MVNRLTVLKISKFQMNKINLYTYADAVCNIYDLGSDIGLNVYIYIFFLFTIIIIQ